MTDLLHPLMPLLHSLFGQDVDWKQVFLVGMTPLFLLAFMVEFVVAR